MLKRFKKWLRKRLRAWLLEEEDDNQAKPPKSRIQLVGGEWADVDGSVGRHLWATIRRDGMLSQRLVARTEARDPDEWDALWTHHSIRSSACWEDGTPADPDTLGDRR